MAPGQETWRARALVALAFAIGACLLALPLFVHSDDGDAMLYRVVARNIVRTGSWTDLTYLTDVYPRFREHLPFGLWPYAAAIRVAGEGALAPVGLLFGLSVLALTGALAQRAFGWHAAWVAMLVLGLSDSFFSDGGRARLDPPLLLFATLAAAPLLLGRRSAGAWGFALLFGALAALVKGPFGVVPLAGAAAALAVTERRPALLFAGGAVTVAALSPAAAFLLHDKLAGDGTWWSGYVQTQLYASAVGAREDGNFAWYFPLATMVNRFWPGLPLSLLGAAWAFSPGGLRSRLRLPAPSPELRRFAWAALFALALLCLPARKLWFHALVAFPIAAVLAAGAVAPFLERLFAASLAARRAAVGTLAAAAGALWLLAATGPLDALAKPPSPICSEFRAWAGSQPPGTRAVVISHRPWLAVSSLAAEFRWDPAVELNADAAGARALLEEDPRYREMPFAWVSADQLPPALPSWEVLHQARGWALLRRAR